MIVTTIPGICLPDGPYNPGWMLLCGDGSIVSHSLGVITPFTAALVPGDKIGFRLNYVTPDPVHTKPPLKTDPQHQSKSPKEFEAVLAAHPTKLTTPTHLPESSPTGYLEIFKNGSSLGVAFRDITGPVKPCVVFTGVQSIDTRVAVPYF